MSKSDDYIELPRLVRDRQADAIQVRKNDKRGEHSLEFPASSEYGVRRPWGTEILSHNLGAVRLDRLRDGAVPLLFNHSDDDPIGMVTGGEIRDGRLEVSASLFDTDRADEVRKMIDGGLRNVSVQYEIHQISERADDGAYVATDWEPLEVSVVTIPADPTVGLSRSLAHEFKPVRVNRAKHQPAKTADVKRGATMDDQNTATAADSADVSINQTRDAKPGPKPVDVQAIERERAETIKKLARSNNIDESIARNWIETGASIDKIADDILKTHEERGKQADAPAMIGMSKKETREYSLMKAIRAASSNNWSKAGLELEAHRALMQRDSLQTREERSFFVPMDVQARAPLYGKRDFNVAGAGNLVATDHLAGSFIDLLRNTSVVMGSGATRLTGLRGNVSIPKMSAGTTAYWLASETTAITESQPTIGQLLLSPKNVAALTEVSHQMMQQGDPSAEDLVLRDLAKSVALAADLGALSGDGTGGQPTGVLNTAGIGSFLGTALDYAAILDAQVDVVKANAMVGSMAYITDPDTTAKLMQRVKFTGTASPIWDGNLLEGDCAGFPGRTSNQMAADSAVFGAWAAVILAEWGVLELAVNPNQNFAAGLTGLRAWYTMDVGVRYAGAFSAANTIT